ncbi:MAG: twin-arginine translocation signal domain-containing protein, partial [Selenomonadaceae bacterium]|nr:twin-arginine translocation signal domain-containing protein [Selenomonadaceae bacterium]
MDITRRDLFKMAGIAALGAAVGQLTTQPAEAAKKVPKLKAAPVVGSKNVTGMKYTGTAAKVYFTDKLDAPHLIKLYNMVNENIIGKVGIKLHTGEPHGPNILPRDWVRQFQAQVPNSNIIETNTLYNGARYTTAGHLETLRTN